MRFIIVSNYYYPEIGAAPNRITNLAEGLAKNFHQVEIICPLPNYPKGKIFSEYKGKLRSKEKQNSVLINRYWIYPSNSNKSFLRIISMLSFAVSLWCFSLKRKKIKEADWIIIQHSPLLVSFSAIILFNKIYKKRIALNVSDLWPLSALELGTIKKGCIYRLLEWIERFNYKNSDMIIGQSEEILEHINQIMPRQSFLYRNIQKKTTDFQIPEYNKTYNIKIIYAGLLGLAQGVYEIVKQLNFSEIGVEFDIYGHGYEKELIVEFLKINPNRGVKYRGAVSKKELDKILPNYQASIVPLKYRLKGAVPSKIFELMQLGVPVLFCGEGEGKKIVEKYHVGYTSPPNDILALKKSIIKLKNLPKAEYDTLRMNCKKASDNVFNFEKQILNLLYELSN